jgi:hypothetical protein
MNSTFHNEFIVNTVFAKWKEFIKMKTKLKMKLLSKLAKNHLKKRNEVFLAMLEKVRDILSERKNEDLALTFHYSVVATRTLYIWKNSVKDIIRERKEIVFLLKIILLIYVLFI